MSRYLIDKLLLAIDRSDDSLFAYRSDPCRFVAGWEESAGEPDPPWPVGGHLTDEERVAFEVLDYGTLYRLGAHPYLLWHVVRAVLVSEALDVHAVSEMYVAAIACHGYPDFTT